MNSSDKSSEELVHCALCSSSPEAHKPLIKVPVGKRGWLGSAQCSVRICSRCGLAFISPRLSEEGYNRYYSQAYYQVIDSETIAGCLEYNRTIAKRILGTVIPYFNLNRSEAVSVLDVGCGYGELLDEFRKRCNASVTGVELSHSAASFARKHFGLDVLEMDINQGIRFEARFDVVFLIATLEHVMDPILMLNGVKELMKSDGYLVILVPDLLGIRRRVTTDKLQQVFKVVHTFYFSIATITALLHRCNLREIFINSGHYSSRNQEDILLIAKNDNDVSYHGEQVDDWRNVLKCLRRSVRHNDLIAYADRLLRLNRIRKKIENMYLKLSR